MKKYILHKLSLYFFMASLFGGCDFESLEYPEKTQVDKNTTISFKIVPWNSFQDPHPQRVHVCMAYSKSWEIVGYSYAISTNGSLHYGNGIDVSENYSKKFRNRYKLSDEIQVRCFATEDKYVLNSYSHGKVKFTIKSSDAGLKEFILITGSDYLGLDLNTENFKIRVE